MKQAERVAATRAKLTGAVFALRHRDPTEPLTVAAVCREADVTKPTFYQYFRSVDALVAEACGEILEQRVEELSGGVPTTELREYIVVLLNRDHRVFEAVRNGGPETRGRVVTAVTARALDWYMATTGAEGAEAVPATVRLRARFAAAGVISLILARLEGGLGHWSMDDLAGEIARLVTATMMP